MNGSIGRGSVESVQNDLVPVRFHLVLLVSYVLFLIRLVKRHFAREWRERDRQRKAKGGGEAREG